MLSLAAQCGGITSAAGANKPIDGSCCTASGGNTFTCQRSGE